MTYAFRSYSHDEPQIRFVECSTFPQGFPLKVLKSIVPKSERGKTSVESGDDVHHLRFIYVSVFRNIWMVTGISR